MMHGSTEITIDASPDEVYAVISDVTRLGEFSPECYACEWNGDVTEPAVGATFTGHNRRGERRWSTVCEVTAAEPGRRFAFEVGPPPPENQKYTCWTYTFEPVNGGTKVTESFEVINPPPQVGEFSEERKAQRVAMLIDAMGTTLARLKKTIEHA